MSEPQSGGPSSRRTTVIWTLLGVTALLLLAAFLLVRVLVSDLPPGTTLLGEGVSTPEEALAEARDIAASLDALPVQLRSGSHEFLLTAGELGASLRMDDLQAAVVDRVGLDDWADRFSGGGDIDLPAEIVVTPPDLSAVAADASRDAVDGMVQITASGVDVTRPQPGVRVTAQAISAAVVPALRGLEDIDFDDWPRPLQITVEGEALQPVVTDASVDALLTDIERILEEPPTLTAQRVPEDAQTTTGSPPPTREPIQLLIDASIMRELLDVEVAPTAIEADRLRLVPRLDAMPLALTEFLEEATIGPELDITVENRSPTPPRAAPDPGPAPTPNADGFAPPHPAGSGGPADQPRLFSLAGVTGDLVATVSSPGLEPDLVATIRALVRAANDRSDLVSVQGREIRDPDPAQLGIVQPVSTFTTFYDPGQSRVTNIHRIAEIVDGTLVPPGGNYNVNQAVGERTAAEGFVSAGAILEGEFISDIGGGVSQFATTMFNAMWFSGVDIITHTPHSFYFERYPAVREATIDFPGVDLELNNNTPHWILIDTAVTDNSVTVTFWSTPYFEVTTGMGPREATADGFRMPVFRRAVSVDGMVDDDDLFTHSYRLP